MIAVENAVLETLQTENLQPHQKVIYLEEQLNWLKRQLFGKKSERDVSQANSQQLQLEGFEQLIPADPETKTIPAHSRKKPNRDGSSAIQLPSDLPESLLPRCQADDTFLAYLLVEKFVKHMPLYRIEEDLKRQGIGISRNLLSKWVIRCGMALKPLYNEMKKHILESQNIFIDETPVKLQDTGKCQTVYMWVIVGG